jgi:hypothetical protein
MHAWRRHVQLLRDHRHQVLECGVAGPCQEIRAAFRRGHGSTQPESFNEIVDEGQVIEDAATADHRKPPAREAAEHSQKPRVARAVNPDRPCHDHVKARAVAKLPRRLLRFELGFLVDVTWVERRILIRGRSGNVPMHAAGAAVHQPPRAAGLGRFQHVARAVDVDGTIRRVGLARFPVRRRDVIDDVNTLRRALHRGRVKKMPFNGDHAFARHLGRIESRAAARPDERPHFVATRGQR